MTAINRTPTAEIALASYGPPLRRPGVGWALGVTLISFIGFFLWQLTSIFHGMQPATLGVFFSALAVTGTFIGFSLLQRGALHRIFLPLVGLFLAILSHMLWNSLGALGSALLTQVFGGLIFGPELAQRFADDPASVPFLVAWPTNVLASLVAGALGYLVVIVGLRRSGRWEQRVMVEQLQNEAGSPVVSAAEYAAIQQHANPPRDKTGRAIFAAQCNLAKRKFYLLQHGLPPDTDPLVAAWRNEAQWLRSKGTSYA